MLAKRCGTWGIVGLLATLLAGCAGGSTSVILATATPACHGGPPLTSTVGTVKLADQLSATITTDAGATLVVHYDAGARFSQLLALPTTALAANASVQIVLQPGSISSLPTARAIIVQPAQTVTDAPSTCANSAQTAIPGVQGQINTVNRNSQQLTLTDNHGQQFLVLFSGATIIGQPAATQPSSVTQGDLVLAVGLPGTAGFDAQSLIIISSGG